MTTSHLSSVITPNGHGSVQLDLPTGQRVVTEEQFRRFELFEVSDARKTGHL